MEEALAAARQEVFDLRGRLAQAREHTTNDVIRRLVAQLTGEGPGSRELAEAGPQVAAYIRSLQLGLREAHEASQLLQSQCKEAQYLETQARRLLADSRDKEAAAHRALQASASGGSCCSGFPLVRFFRRPGGFADAALSLGGAGGAEACARSRADAPRGSPGDA